ncbi:MAG: hypothetical protein ABIK89_06125 [Planctomycetota bacterium]
MRLIATALSTFVPVLICVVAPSTSMCGEAEPASWWEAETAMGPGGTLTLTEKPWWERAQALEVGEHFTERSDLPGGGQMLIRRERSKLAWGYGGRKASEADVLVWVLDDDGDFRSGDTDGDKDSDCYVADYEADGRVDRMVDYIDDDGDNKADEMDIRYFDDGRLAISWFGVDLDEDGHLWSVGNYEYAGGFFRSDPYGDNLVYANRYDPDENRWFPMSECPFAFYDTDGDGESEAVVRVSAVPLDFDPETELDPGNSLFNYTLPFTERMRHPGAVNFRYSRDLDGLSSPERRLHYDMGFNLIGRVPYQFEGMARETPLRRAPKTTNVIPHEDLIRVAESYPAETTGFSWHEYGDDAVSLGYEPRPGEDRRWEGIFWTWSRRFMHNTGGPIQNWNMRREFCPTPSNKRELYYCRADHRIHLKGATDGWIRVGHLANTEPWGEIRFFDTDRDGYFDRWETHLADVSAPVRVSTVRDLGIRDLPDDWDAIGKLYTQEILPEALQANENLMAAMGELADFGVPENLAKALEAATCDGEKLYVQDIIRETQYLDLREKLSRKSTELFAAFPPADLRSKPDELKASIRAWTHARLMTDLDTAYAEGRYDDAARLLGEIRNVAVSPE